MFKKDNLIKVTIWFAILFPLSLIEFFYHSFTTLGIVFIIFSLLLWLFCIDKDARKHGKWLFLYFLLVILYTLFHHANALHFQSFVPGNFHYSFSKEGLQILKMSMPVCLFFLLWHLSISKKQYLTVLKSWIVFICGSIIVTNLFKISLGSYSDSYILGNIFDWFNTSLTYYDLASKGWFMYANQISAVLVCLLPITYYYHTKKEISLIYVIIMLLSLLMLGTRVANIGGILVFFIMISTYLFFGIIKEYKIDVKIIVISLIMVIVYCIILPFSPTMSRDKIFDHILKDKQQLVYEGEMKFDKLQYIKDNYEDKNIADQFILDSYPYQYDPDFWLEILELPEEKRINYRFLEIEMVKRVVTINNNPNDLFLGITNIRIQNIFSIERDFIAQYYAYGIIGMILFLSVYFAILGIFIQKIVKQFEFRNACYLAFLILFLGIALMSGNLLGQLPSSLSLLLLTITGQKLAKQ